MLHAELLDHPDASLLIALRVAHADGERCRAELDDMTRALATQDGFKGAHIIRRDGGLGKDFFALLRFRAMADLERWQASSAYAASKAALARLSVADVSHQRVAGSNIWFEPIDSLASAPLPPRFWKRWAVSMLAVYPALILLVRALEPVTQSLPQALGLLVVALVLTGLSTAWIVPFLTRTLHPWLIRR